MNTVIFDMDGLLIDSEPLWEEAATEAFARFGIHLSAEEYMITTGLRTREFVTWWLTKSGIDEKEFESVENEIITGIMLRIKTRAVIMPGVDQVIGLFRSRDFRIGVASSSPQQLIDLVMDMSGIGSYVHATASAEHLPYGKPHPQVYLDCARSLGTVPTACICFEDSFNGMIAAKAARMKCVVVPHPSQARQARWGAADLQLSSLLNFGQLHLDQLS